MIAKASARLYAASVSPLKDPKLYRMAYAAASDERRRKVDGYRFDKDRRLSLGAEMLLRHGLREADVSDGDFCVKTNDCGKPYLENADLYYNISHSGDWVVCAVSDDEIGCDIEEIQSAEIRIAEQFFCPEEYLHIARQLSADARNALFYRYWTLKESFMKVTGMGMTLPINAFRIVIGDPIRVIQSLDQRGYSFTEFADIPGYCCAVCETGDAPKVSIEVLNLSRLCGSEKSDR